LALAGGGTEYLMGDQNLKQAVMHGARMGAYAMPFEKLAPVLGRLITFGGRLGRHAASKVITDKALYATTFALDFGYNDLLDRNVSRLEMLWDLNGDYQKQYAEELAE